MTAASLRNMLRVIRPDGFALFLWTLGFVLLVVPMMVVPGLVSLVAGTVYWSVMASVRLIFHRLG